MRTLCWTPREEVNAAITWLKCRKIAGLDGFQPKHLKYGREILTQWFTRALNCVLDLETVPQIFKHSITVPVCKGEGRNPFSCGSDCDIPLVSYLETCHAEMVSAHSARVANAPPVPDCTQQEDIPPYRSHYTHHQPR